MFCIVSVSVSVSECQQTQQHVPRRFASYSVLSESPPTPIDKYSFLYTNQVPPNQNPLSTFVSLYDYYYYYYYYYYESHLFAPPPPLHSPTTAATFSYYLAPTSLLLISFFYMYGEYIFLHFFIIKYLVIYD